MRQPSPAILADLIREKANSRPDLCVLTFEHLSLDDEATTDEVRTYADLSQNADRIARSEFVGVAGHVAVIRIGSK